MSASKSCIWFSPRILRRLKDQVVGIFGIPTTDRIGIIFELPFSLRVEQRTPINF